MDIIDKITDILKPVARNYGVDIIQISFNSNVLQFLIEKENYITATIDDCEKVSKAFSAILDVEDIIKNKYFLEVSSVGMNRPLLNIADYQHFKGKYVKIELCRKIDDVKIFKGYIDDVKDEMIILKIKLDNTNKLINLNIKDIFKAHLLVTDEMLKQILKETKKKGKNKNV